MNKTLYNAYEVLRKKVNMYLEKYNGEPYQFHKSASGDYYSDAGKVYFSERAGWMASFVTGLGPLMYNVEKDEKYLKWASQFKDDYRRLITENPIEKSAHDVGFLYSLYSVAMYKITGDRGYREIALKAADELAKRFHINARAVLAWGAMNKEDYDFWIIIDTMMNLPLLFWAWEETGHRFYRDVASFHCETVSKLHIRDDFSVCHGFTFDKDSGKILREKNTCGYDDGSHWSRGTGWAVYGFAIAARYLKNEEYFNLATKIAEKYIASLPEGKYVPAWDLRLPKDKPAKIYGSVFSALKNGAEKTAPWDETKKENCKYNVDSSAAAIIACGLMELNKHKENKAFSEFIDNTLEELCNNYLNKDETVQGILMRQNGEDVYTPYGDYFFAEALTSRLFNIDVPW